MRIPPGRGCVERAPLAGRLHGMERRAPCRALLVACRSKPRPRYRRCCRIGLPKAFGRPAFCLKLAFLSCILLLVGALVASGDCIRAGRPFPASEPSVLSAPAPCAIANPQLPRSNPAANVSLVAFNIADLL